MTEISLNNKQKEAVEHKNGPLLIIAGAGAGKTRVITSRIINLIKNGVSPSEILAVTFTNKAAREMKERVEFAIKKESLINFPMQEKETPHVSTFHSLGVRIIKENAKKIGVKKHFTIYDRADSIKNIKEAIKASQLDPKQVEPKKVLSFISRQKGAGIEPEEFIKDAPDLGYFESLVGEIWEIYEKNKQKDNALDFDDLLLKSVKLLSKNPEVLNFYLNRWRYIHIDEYQDTNKIQDEFTELLAREHKNICVVGDIDQNIFSWRGADISNLLLFEKRYPELKTVFLEENYRSTKNIIEASNRIIEKNAKRPKKIMSTKKEAGEKIGFFVGDGEKDEAEFVAKKAKGLSKKSGGAKEIAALYRTNFQSRALEEAFIKNEVPHQILGTKFFDRKEVKDALAFLKLALNPDSLSDLKRAVEAVPLGIGKATLLKIANNQEEKLGVGVKKKVAEFKELMEDIKKAVFSASPSSSMKYIIKRSGLLNYYSGKDEDSEERLLNLKEIISVAGNYDAYTPEEGIDLFLENVSLATDQDTLNNSQNSVKLMTIHAAKGLEFDFVFTTGLEQGLFPHEASAFDDEDRDEEEERRLFYVALTRAKKKTFLTYAATRNIFGSRQVNEPSEFLRDIDEEFLEAEGAEGEIIY